MYFIEQHLRREHFGLQVFIRLQDFAFAFENQKFLLKMAKQLGFSESRRLTRLQVRRRVRLGRPDRDELPGARAVLLPVARQQDHRELDHQEHQLGVGLTSKAEYAEKLPKLVKFLGKHRRSLDKFKTKVDWLNLKIDKIKYRLVVSMFKLAILYNICQGLEETIGGV